MEQQLTHFDASGNAVMVDVSGKAVTSRTAVAQGSILVNEAVRRAVQDERCKKEMCWVWPGSPGSWRSSALRT